MWIISKVGQVSVFLFHILFAELKLIFGEKRLTMLKIRLEQHEIEEKIVHRGLE